MNLILSGFVKRLLASLSVLLLMAGAAHAQVFLNVNKSFTPINVAVGKTSSLVITFSNTSGSTPATAVAGTDTLPAGLALVSVGAATCGFNTTASAFFSVGATLGWTDGVVPPNSTCTLTAVVSPYQAGTWINTIPTSAVSGFIGTETVSGFSTASATITANGTLTGLSIGKTANGTIVRGDGTRSYTISLTNQNALPLTGMAFTDTLPAKLRVAVPGGVTFNTCGGTTQNTLGGVIADGDLGIRLVGGTLAASGSCSVTFVVRLIDNTTLERGGNSVVNSVNLVTTNEGIRNANNASVALAYESGVYVDKIFSPNSIPAGGTSMLIISVVNHNINSIPNIGLTDTLPAGLTALSFAGVQGGGCSSTPTVVVTPAQVSFSDLIRFGQSPNFGGVTSCNLQFVVTAPAVGTYVNTIPAGTFTGGFPYFQASNSLLVINPISGSKAFAPANILQGGTALLTISLSNAAAVAALNTDFVDNLTTMGAGITIAASPAPTNTCGGALTAVAGASTLALAGGTIGPASTCQVTVPVLVAFSATTGTRVNTIPAASVTSSLGSGAAALSANLRVLADIDVSKVFSSSGSGGVVPQTGSTLLTISLFNAAGGANAAIASFVDDLTTLGAGFVIGPTPAPTNTCGGTLSAVAGSSTIALQGGTIVSGSSCQLTLPVVVPASQFDSNRLNTIAAGALVTDQGSNTNPASAGFRVIDALRVSKAYAPNIIGPGQVSRLSVTITHTVGAVAFTGMAFTDALPPGHTVANPPNVFNTCGGAVAAGAGASSFTLSGAGLPVGATSCVVALDIQSPPGTGVVANTIPPGSVTTAESVINWLQASATLDRRIGTPAAINKSFTPANIASGASSVLRVVVSNPNPYPLTSVALIDAMPDGMSVFGLPATNTTCGAGVVTALPGANTVALSKGTVPALGSCFFEANVTSIVAGNVVNTIPMGVMSNAQSVTNNNTSSASLQVLNNLSLSKVFIPVVAQAGLTSSLVVTVGNSLSTTVAGLNPNAFTDLLPPGLEIASNLTSSSCGGSITDHLGAPLDSGAAGFRLNGGSFALGSQCTVSVVVRTVVAGATGSFVNTIALGALNTVEGPTNIFPAVATVSFVANPTIAKAFTPALVKAGSMSTITFTLNNPNGFAQIPGGLSGAAFSDVLPSGMSVFAPGPAGGTCVGAAGNNFSAGQTVLSFTGLTIPPSGQCTVSVAVVAPTAGIYVNTVTGVVSLQTPIATSVVNAATLTVLAPPSISKFFSPSVVLSAGTGTSVLTIVVTNPNATTPLTLDFPGVLDVFPVVPGAMVVGAMPAATNCAGGTLQASNGTALAAFSTGIRLMGGTVPPNGSCTISVTVLMPTPGTYINTSAAVNSTNAGSSVDGATASVQTILAANLTIQKDNGISTAVSSSTVSYTITVANLGPASASGTVVRDTPGEGLVCNILSCSATGGAACPVLNLPLFLSSGLSLPALPAQGQVVFVLGCDITASGL